MSARQAAKRVSRHTVDWSGLSRRMTSNEMAMYRAFKARSDAYVNSVSSLPEQPPKIDWENYKRLSGQPRVVDSLRQAYESLKIDYPGDQGLLAEIDKEEQDTHSSVEKLRQEVKELKVEAQDALQRWEALPPMSTMTHEEFYISFPDQYSYQDQKIEPMSVFDTDMEMPEMYVSREFMMTPEEKAEWRKRANAWYDKYMGPNAAADKIHLPELEAQKHSGGGH